MKAACERAFVLSMWFDITFVLIILLFSSCNLFVHNKNLQTQTRPSLQLTTSIINQQYCKGSDGGFDSLQLNLLLRYTNTGQQKLILYKGSNEIYRQMISRTTEDAAVQKFEMDLSLTVLTEERPIITDGSSLDKNFVILLPGDSYETEAGTSSILFLKEKDNEVSDGKLGVGEYFLQISVSTWPWAQSLTESLRNRWNENGFLWSETVTSAPMPFKVEKERRFVNCRS